MSAPRLASTRGSPRLGVTGTSLLVVKPHPILHPIPDGITVTVAENTKIKVEGIDKQQVGQFAAEVRAVRKPEPYKGKGIRYDGEVVKIKPGKAAT